VKHAIAIAALVATTVGTIALPVVAQDTTQAVSRKADREIHRMMPRGARGSVVSLVCSERGAEALEIAFVRLSHRIELTAEQQALFDTLRTDALTAQTAFADSCAAAWPAADTGAPDLIARFKARLEIEQARLDAMTKLLPDLEAFYASLTDAQKAELLPQRGGFHRGPGAGAAPAPDRNAPGRDAPGRDAPGRTDRAPAPGRG
jgi:hypothetical protein